MPHDMYRYIGFTLVLVFSRSIFAGDASAGELYKCQRNDDVLYQAFPCPPAYQTLPVAPAATAVDQTAAAQARAQARADIAAAERLRQRETREAAQRQARAAKAERHAQNCARRLEVIRMMESVAAEAPAARKPASRRALNERKAYILQCGPLPK